MPKNTTLILSYIEESLLPTISNEQLYQAVMNPEGEESKNVYQIFKKKEHPTGGAYNFSHYLSEEFTKRLNNGDYSTTDIISGLSSLNLFALQEVLQNAVKADNALLVPILKKVAHLKDEHIVHNLITTVTHSTEFQNAIKKQSELSTENMEILRSCLKIVNSKGNNSAIHALFSYILVLDIRNVLSIQTKNDIPYTQKSNIDKNKFKEEIIYEHMEELPKKDFPQHNKHLINLEHSKILNFEGIYQEFSNSPATKNSTFIYFRVDKIFGNAYKKTDIGNAVFNDYVEKTLNTKDGYLHTPLIGDALEYAPHLRDDLVEYLIREKLEAKSSTVSAFNHLLSISYHCPSILDKLPSHYLESNLFNLVSKNPKIFKYWKEDDIPNALNDALSHIKIFIDKPEYKFSRSRFLSDFCENFPFEKISDEQQNIHNLHLLFVAFGSDSHRNTNNISESSYQSFQTAITKLPILTQEKLISASISNYQELLQFDKFVEKQSLPWGQKPKEYVLSNFSFNDLNLDKPLIKSFLKFLHTHSTLETLEQLLPKRDSKDARFEVSMEFLMNISEEDLFNGLKQLSRNSYTNSMNIREDTLANFLEDIYDYRYGKAYLFVEHNFNKFNKDYVAVHTFFEQCFILVQEEKMLSEAPINSQIIKPVSRKF